MEDFKLIIKPDASRLLTAVHQILQEKDIQAYVAGGFMRDALLGRETADIDIAVAADALSIAPEVAAALGGKYVPLDRENGVARVVLPDAQLEIDFTTLQGNIEQDLARRDFTIDAMAIELNGEIETTLDTGRLIDPFNGRDDLRRGTIRVVGQTAFAADAARLIRAVRLAAELDFNIEPSTEELIRQNARLITGIAGERVREELLRLLAIPGAATRLFYMDDLGLLTALIPELEPARGVSQPRVHVWDVFGHSLQTVAAVEFLLREGPCEFAGEEVLEPVPWSVELSQHFDKELSHGSKRRTLLKLAALLHDIAKPRTKTMDEGRARFLGHPLEGAATAAAILERLRFSNREIKLVELLIRYHLRPTQMSHEGVPTRRAIYRYYRDTGEAGIDILFLSLADHLATRGSSLNLRHWREHARMTAYVLAGRFEEEEISAPPKLVDGHDVMKTFGLTPGPKVGELLESLREMQAVGEVSTRQQALDYIQQLLAGQPAGTAHIGENDDEK